MLFAIRRDWHSATERYRSTAGPRKTMITRGFRSVAPRLAVWCGAERPRHTRRDQGLASRCALLRTAISRTGTLFVLRMFTATLSAVVTLNPAEKRALDERVSTGLFSQCRVSH